MMHLNRSITYTSLAVALIIFLFSAGCMNSSAKEKREIAKAVFYVA